MNYRSSFTPIDTTFVIVNIIIIIITVLVTPSMSISPQVSHLAYTKIPIDGTYLKEYETLSPVKSRITCSAMCARRMAWVSEQCIGFNLKPSDASCRLYTLGNNVVDSTGSDLEHVYIVDFQKDMFYTIATPTNQRISIYLSSTSMNYNSASDHCKLVGGYLLDINSMVEYDVLQIVMKEQDRGTSYFIGADDRETEGTWISDRTGQAANESVLNWFPGEPTNFYENEHCLVIANMLANDVPCYYNYLFICERNTGHHYDNDGEVIADVHRWCRGQSSEFFADGVCQLVKRWRLCVDRDGDYVEQ